MFLELDTIGYTLLETDNKQTKADNKQITNRQQTDNKHTTNNKQTTNTFSIRPFNSH
jgi:hypothetical protein